MLVLQTQMQMFSLYKQVRGVCLGLPGWGLKITTYPRLAVSLHPCRLCVLAAAALCATLHLITGFCAGREGGQCCLPAFVFRGSHHIADKVEEGDMPDLAQHELMLWFS